MDSKTASPSTHYPLAAMFQNATLDKAEKSEFNNSARDNIKLTVNNYNFTKEGENLVLESCDVIDCVRNAVQPFLAEIRKNDHARSTVGDTTSTDGSETAPQTKTTEHTVEGNPVEVIDLVPSETSSFRVASVADRYTRSMLKCLAGYPLYEPQPFSELSKEYMRHGVNVGDVGFVRGDGVFDFLFNVCPSNNSLINPHNLSHGFSLETTEHSSTRAARALPRKTCLFQSPITRTKSGEYICEGSEGAILELPEGAIQEEATNIRPFSKLAARHGVQWYEYTMSRGREISNGSLYLITSFTKCSQWGIAVFDRPCAPEQGLTFEKKRSLRLGKSASKYHWKGSRAFPTKASDHNQGDYPNQCVFLRGYKIMIRQDIFDNLCDDQLHGSASQAGTISVTRNRATRIRGGGGSDPMSKRLSEGLLSWTTMPTMRKSDEVVLHANFNSFIVHPSDLINAALLSQNTDAKVALTHDDVWCNILRDNFPKLNYTTLINTARSYMNTVDQYDCVTLEKIPDLSDVLDGSYHPLQCNETPTLQAPLITLDDDYIPSPVTISMILPHELVERILLLLDNKSMLRCKLVNREFNQIIQSSASLQYFLACKAAGVMDNPRSPLSYAERLEALKKREDAWRKLKPVFEMTIRVNHQTASQLLRSIEGVYFISDDNQKDLNYCHLNSFPQDNPRWIRIPGSSSALNWSGILVNFVAALHEHDLIVNLISSEIGNQGDMQRHSLDLVLLKFSAGEYHPLARRPLIHVQRSQEVEPWVDCSIVGDNLALLVHSNDGTSSDKLFIFDWKTGRKRLQHEASENPYLGLVFVSPELLLVPNSFLSHFEVWHLPPHQLDHKPPIQILSLRIPAASPDYSISRFDCYGEPNTFLHSLPYFPPRPFFPSPESSIIVVKLRMWDLVSSVPISYNIIMHRCALLDTIHKWTSPSPFEQQGDIPVWLTNEVTVHRTADHEDGLDAESKLVSMVPDPTRSPTPVTSPTSYTSHTHTDSGPSSVSSGLSTNSSTFRCTFLQVPWVKWGPPISRWFHLSETQARSLRHCNGQRYAFSDPNPLSRRKIVVSVADFNPHNVRKNTEMMARLRSVEGDNNGGNSNRDEGGKEEEEEEFEILDHKGVFLEEVFMGLKCVVYRAPDEYDFDLVMMDEERLLGMKLNHDGWYESVKVLYIG